MKSIRRAVGLREFDLPVLQLRNFLLISMSVPVSIRRFLALLLVLTVGLQTVVVAGPLSCQLESASSERACCDRGTDSQSCCGSMARCRCHSSQSPDHNEIAEICQCGSNKPVPVTPNHAEDVSVLRMLLTAGNTVIVDAAEFSVPLRPIVVTRPASNASLNVMLCVWQT